MIAMLTFWSTSYSCSHDGRIYILAVVLLYLMSIAHSAALSHTLYEYTVTHAGDNAYLLVAPW